MYLLLSIKRTERTGLEFPEATKYLNLEGLESFDSDKKRNAQYKANAESWDAFIKSKDSLSDMKTLYGKIQSNIKSLDLEKALAMYESMVKKVNPANKDYTHYPRSILTKKKIAATDKDYKKKIAILVVLQCPKAASVGLGCVENEDKTASGDWMETVFYPFLKGMI
jgi:ribosomal protein S20